MTPESITMIITGGVVLLGMWRLLEGLRLDLTAEIKDLRSDLTNQITAVNTRIDNVLLDRPR